MTEGGTDDEDRQINADDPAAEGDARGLRRVARAVRGGGVVLAWARVRGATSYTTSVTLGDGRMLGATVPARCRGVLFHGVASSVSVSAKVAALRPDLVSGPFIGLLLRPGVAHGGASGVLPNPIC